MPRGADFLPPGGISTDSERWAVGARKIQRSPCRLVKRVIKFGAKEAALRRRSNEEWLSALDPHGPEDAGVLADLTELLRRAAFFYLRRHSRELKDYAAEEIDALAEDAAQEAVMAVRMKLATFRGESAFPTWASKFAVGKAMATLRKRQWRDVSLDRLPDGWDQPAETAIARDGWQQPELAAERQEVWRAIREAVKDDLTEKQRQVLNYVLIQGVNVVVVAERLGVSPGAVYKLTHDARRKLLVALEKRGWSKEQILSAFATSG